MIEVKVSKGAQSVISSRTVKEHLESMAEMILVSDISDVARQKNIMLFDCKLDNIIFKFSYFDGTTIEEFDIGTEYYQILLDDLDFYIAELIEDVREELSILYDTDDILMYHEIYDLNETFSDVKFVIAMAFDPHPQRELEDITRLTAKRQSCGSSKYFN